LRVAQTMAWTFDFKLDDVVWRTAAFGRSTGHSSSTSAPRPYGSAQVVVESLPTYTNAGRYWRLIADHRVTAICTEPTAMRSLIKAPDADAVESGSTRP
ncbi:acetyl-coenzyme A synthetase, partial [Burkholderia pseudomallei]|nr:acetyl-coenzyme A synthetase [Burkholderia pseudomallei]